jgi:biopolymer transport protein TolR
MKSLMAVMFLACLTASPVCTAQKLQKGIPVVLPVSTSAVAVPDADKADAPIVAITGAGHMYFGTDPIPSAALPDRIRHSDDGAKLYIKADSHLAFADVARVLNAARAAGFDAVTLLASQPEPTYATYAPPKGLVVAIGPSNSRSGVLVEMLKSTHSGSILKINGKQVSTASLQNRLWQMLEDKGQKAISVKAHKQVRFADVVRVIDACYSTGAKVGLAL